LVGLPVQDSASSHGYTSFKSIEEPKLGLWQTLASKAKGILDDDGLAHKFEDLRKERPRTNTTTASSKDQVRQKVYLNIWTGHTDNHKWTCRVCHYCLSIFSNVPGCLSVYNYYDFF
jgi:hypothetical protein